jgi:hypothetical protein
MNEYLIVLHMTAYFVVQIQYLNQRNEVALRKGISDACHPIRKRPGTFERVRLSKITQPMGAFIPAKNILSICCEL